MKTITDAAALNELADTAPHQEFVSLIETTFKG